MENDLQTTCPLWTRDADKVMKHQEDLFSQCKLTRVPSFVVHDQALASQIKCKESGTLQQREIQEKAEKERKIARETV